ncbi:hypothetical protein [Deinococcus hopiensis]|nr:hypothetical protein [Deinococcus hopiensis]
MPQAHTALHFARLWFVLCLDRDMSRAQAEDFAMMQAVDLLSNTIRDTDSRTEAGYWIRRDLQSLQPNNVNPLNRASHIDTRS